MSRARTRRSITALLCVLLMLSAAGCVTVTPNEERPQQASAAIPAPEPTPTQGLEPMPESEAEPEPEPYTKPEPEPGEGMAGHYHVKIAETYKSPLWELNALFVGITFANESGQELYDPPLSVKAFQDGTELVYSLNPSPAPGRLEVIFQLNSTQSEMKLRVEEVHNELEGRYETALRLDEIETRAQEVTVQALDEYAEAARHANHDTLARYALPDQWPLGAPFYDGAWRIQPFISDTIDSPQGATINLNDYFEFDMFMAYVEKCVALGYVKSGEKNIESDKRKALSDDNANIYRVMLTGQAYSIYASYRFGGEDADFNWVGLFVKRIRE